ncbi:hypothetical protein DITRI_Ditri01bG0118900 [Diplodiscus trichospermus]
MRGSSRAATVRNITRELDESYKEFEIYDSDGSASSSSQRQLELYLDISSDSFDVIGFWKNSYSRYPDLARMARDIMSIPITTVASESFFSIGGRVLNWWRSSLKWVNAQMLITIRNWLCGFEAFEDEMDNLEFAGEEIDFVESMMAFSIASEEDSNFVD